MTATTEQAKDQMFGLVRDTAAIVAPGIHIEWQGVANNSTPPQDAEWLRVSMKHHDGFQASLSCEHNQRRWRREGELYVQCFATEVTGGLKRAMELACAFRDAIQGTATAGGVWFRRVQATEVGPDKNWFNANTSAQFNYDEVK